MSVQSEVDSLWMLCDKGDLTCEQFFVAVGITLGRLERSEGSKRLSEVIAKMDPAKIQAYLASQPQVDPERLFGPYDTSAPRKCSTFTAYDAEQDEED